MKKHHLAKYCFFTLAILMLLALCGCGQLGGTVIDYGDAESFEAALNEGKNLEGKVVRFTVSEFHPDSLLGYNAWAGEHLNFVSARNPDIQANDIVTVRTTTIENRTGRWVINYEKVDDGVIGEDTITYSKSKETTSITSTTRITAVKTTTAIQTTTEKKTILHGFNNTQKENVVFSINELNFTLPFYYIENADYRADDAVLYCAYDNKKTMSTFNVVYRKTKPEANQTITEFLVSYEESLIKNVQKEELTDTELISKGELTIAGLPAIHVAYGGLNEKKEKLNYYDTLIYNQDKAILFIIRNIEDDGCKYDLSEDRKEILKRITSGTANNSSDVSPDFKVMMDSYEQFFDEYIAFMQNYENSDDPIALLNDYMDYMTKYTDYMQKLNNVDTESLSIADLAYYNEVNARILKKLAAVSAIP